LKIMLIFQFKRFFRFFYSFSYFGLTLVYLFFFFNRSLWFFFSCMYLFFLFCLYIITIISLCGKIWIWICVLFWILRIFPEENKKFWEGYYKQLGEYIFVTKKNCLILKSSFKFIY
jgi:hypothetical protein